MALKYFNLGMPGDEVKRRLELLAVGLIWGTFLNDIGIDSGVITEDNIEDYNIKRDDNNEEEKGV